MTSSTRGSSAPGEVRLRDAVAAPPVKAAYTRWVFATIADRYDLVNVLLSFNRDRAWKRRMVERLGVRRGEHALDLACGTGDITFRLTAAGARVVGLDITPRMIEIAIDKVRSRTDDEVPTPLPPHFLVGDMTSLPFPDASFDLVTTGYGLRNVPDLDAALAEIRRVLRPGGRVSSLDFNRPANGLVRWAYLAYLSVVGFAIGSVLYGKADTYRYIPATIRLHPGGRQLALVFERAGFVEVSYRPVFGGFMALHNAVKPPL